MQRKTSNLPTRNHYVPQFYLRGFSQDQKYIYQLDKNKGEIKPLPIDKVGFKRNLYTYKSIDGTTESLEDMFSQMEGVAAAIIRKLENKEDISLQERADLSVYMSIQMVRTPASKNELLSAQAELVEKTMRRSFEIMPTSYLQSILAEKGRVVSEVEAEELKAFAIDESRSKLEMTFPPEYWQRHMMKLGMNFYRVFYICDWEIRHSFTPFGFITSDHPYMLIPGEKPHPFFGVGMITPKAKKIVPLSSKICLIAHEPSESAILAHTEADKDFFRKINRWTVENAERFVFSSDFGKVQKIVKENKELLKTPKRYSVE